MFAAAWLSDLDRTAVGNDCTGDIVSDFETRRAIRRRHRCHPSIGVVAERACQPGDIGNVGQLADNVVLEGGASIEGIGDLAD